MTFLMWKVCIILILIISSLEAKECPSWPLRKPCQCVNDDNGISVNCKNAHGYQEIVSSLEDMAGRIVTSLDISNSNLNHVSYKSFTNMKVSELRIFNTSLYYLFDEPLTGDVTSSLVTLALERVTFIGGLDWNTLANLKNLLYLKVIGTNLKKLPKSFRNLSLPRLEALILNNDKIGDVDPRIFTGFTGMENLELTHNSLSKLERQMFPYPAAIRKLDLSNNNFEKFQPDIFQGMPHLHTLILSNNKFVTIDKNYIGVIFKQLRNLSFINNPIQCDYRLQWMISIPQPVSFLGQCTRGGTKAELNNLREEDLYEKAYIKLLRALVYNALNKLRALYIH